MDDKYDSTKRAVITEAMALWAAAATSGIRLTDRQVERMVESLHTNHWFLNYFNKDTNPPTTDPNN